MDIDEMAAILYTQTCCGVRTYVTPIGGIPASGVEPLRGDHRRTKVQEVGAMESGNRRCVPVPGFEGYRVWSSGRIQSRRRGGRWRDIRPRPDHKGYLRVALRRDGQTHDLKVHRLVLEAFVGPCPEGMECCHNDGDPTNNRIDNLRWDTPKANAADVGAHGRRPQGSGHYAAKLTDEEVGVIRRGLAAGAQVNLVARRFGVHRRTIQKIARGQTWSHVAAGRG
jgi:hypothetical protein